MRRVAAVLPLLLLACEPPVVTDDLEDLEAPFGGLDFRRESPLFGQRAQFEAAGEAEALQAMTVAAPPATGDVVIWAGWGHFTGQRDETAAFDWTGALQAAHGQLSLLRTIAFDRNDRVLDPPDDATVAFQSRTRPHFDGIVTRATTRAAAPAALTLTTREGAFTHQPGSTPTVAEQALPDGVRVAFISVPLTGNACDHAVAMGRWRAADRTARRRGIESRLVGRWFTPEGALVGHWRALAGHRGDGTEVLFGKLIDPDGQALALLRGTVRGDVVETEIVGPGGDGVGTFSVKVPDDAAPTHSLVVPALTQCVGTAG